MAFGDIVQTVTESGNSTEDPVSLAFGSAVTAGNLIVIGIYVGDSPMAPGTGLTETIENVDATEDDSVALHHRVVQGGDGQTWTVDLPAADQYAAVMWEIEGPFEASPLDQTGSTAFADDRSTQAVTAAGATSQNDEVVFAAWGHRTLLSDSNGVTISSVSDTFTNLTQVHDGFGGNTRKSVGVAKKVLTATGTPTTTATFSAATGRTGAVLATFKKTAAGGALTISATDAMNNAADSLAGQRALNWTGSDNLNA